MNEFWKFIKRALRSELETDVGRVDLVFGVALFAITALAAFERGVEILGRVVFSIFGRDFPIPLWPHEYTLLLVLALFLYFVVSVLATTHGRPKRRR